jgi:hypothetical protein
MDSYYITIVANMLEKFKVLRCLMILKFIFWIHTWIFSWKSWCSK